MCEEALGQGGRVNRVCAVCRLNFYALLCRAWPKICAADHGFLRGRELFAPRPPVDSACKSPPNG